MVAGIGTCFLTHFVNFDFSKQKACTTDNDTISVKMVLWLNYISLDFKFQNDREMLLFELISTNLVPVSPNPSFDIFTVSILTKAERTLSPKLNHHPWNFVICKILFLGTFAVKIVFDCNLFSK